jgi:phage shock protein A
LARLVQGFRHHPAFRGPLMGIFSRTRDIIAANMTDMLDRAEDPPR